MSIDKDLEAYDELCDELAYVGSRKFDQGLVADAIVALIDAKLDARLSPAPVGGETYRWDGNPFTAPFVATPTPPPAEPDGGGVGDAGWAHEAGKELQIAYERAESISPLKLNTALRHGFEAIADLEQRLAEARRVAAQNAARAKESDEIADNARATIAERDRRIAALEAGLEPFANAVFNDNGDVSYDLTMYGTRDLFRAYSLLRRALISPATDKGA